MVMRLLCSRSATAALEAESLDSSNIIILSSSSSLLTPEVSVTLGAVSTSSCLPCWRARARWRGGCTVWSTALHWTRTITRWVQPKAGQLISRGCLAAPLSYVLVLRRQCSSSPDTEPFRGLAWPLGWMVVVLRDLPCTNRRSVFWTVDQSQISITCTPMSPPLLPDIFLPPQTWSLRVASSQMTVSGLWERSSMSVDWLAARGRLARNLCGVLSWEKKSRFIVRIVSRQVSNVWRDNTISGEDNY